MDFDFKTTFAGYSNVALLSILVRPGDYSPEAIAAAQEILAARDVTDEERTLAAGAPPVAVTTLPGPAAETADYEERSIFDDEQLVYSRRFLSIKWSIIIIIGLQLLISLYGLFDFIRLVFYFINLYSILSVCISCCMLGFAVYALYQLAKMKKSGWICTYLINLYYLTSSFSLFMVSMTTRGGLAPLYFVQIVMNASALWYLMRHEFFGHYVEYNVFQRLRLWGFLATGAYLLFRSGVFSQLSSGGVSFWYFAVSGGTHAPVYFFHHESIPQLIPICSYTSPAAVPLLLTKGHRYGLV